MACAVVKFLDLKCNAVVPITWIKGIFCAWPPKHLEKAIKISMEKNELPLTPSDTWDNHRIRTLGIYPTYREANSKLPKSLETSDIQTTDPETLGKGKRGLKKKQKCSGPCAEPGESDKESTTSLEDPPLFNPGMTSTPYVIGLTKITGDQEDTSHVIMENYEEDYSNDQEDTSDVLMENYEEGYSTSLLTDRCPIILPRQELPNQCQILPEKELSIVVETAPYLQTNQNVVQLQEASTNGASLQTSENLGRPPKESTNKRASFQADLTVPPPKRQQKITLEEIGAYLKSISRDISILKASQRTLQESMDVIIKQQNTEQPESNYNNFKLIKDMLEIMPIKNPEDLNKFEEHLIDENTQKQMVKYLTQIGGTNLDQVTKQLLRRIVCDEVAMLFSFHGARGKMAFKDLRIYSVIWETVRKTLKNVTQADIDKFVATWLRHAKGRFCKKNAK